MATILIVDDEPANRLYISTVLKGGGHDAVAASNGQAGIDAAIAHRPELIIADFHMPGMSGVEFIKALREHPETRTTSVALYTATIPDSAIEQFMELAGIKYAIPKPADPESILRIVELALRDP